MHSTTRLSRRGLIVRNLAFLCPIVLIGSFAPQVSATIYVYENVADVAIPQPPGGHPTFGGCSSVGGTLEEIEFVVTDSFTVESVAVGLNIDHNTRGEVVAALVAPGSPITANAVFLAPSGDSGNDHDVMFADATGLGTGEDGVSASDGDSDPLGVPYYHRIADAPALGDSRFVGISSAGTWRVLICDTDQNGASGRLERARLVLTEAGDQPNVCASTATYEWASAGSGFRDFDDATVQDITVTEVATSNPFGTGVQGFGTCGSLTGSGACTTFPAGGVESFYIRRMVIDDDEEEGAMIATFSFDPPVRDLQFQHLDVDQQTAAGWEDFVRVEVRDADGNTLPYDANPESPGDIEQFGDIFGGDLPNKGGDDPDANLHYHAAGPVATLTVEYFAGDEPGSWASQFVGLGDLSMCAYDFGDAPESYSTSLNGGARHVLGSRLLRLGALPADGEADGQPTAMATGDGVDEDGVAAFPPATLQPGGEYVVPVVVTNLSGGPADLCGWFDFDLDGGAGDGSFESDEGACVSVPASGGNTECTELGGGVWSCEVTFTVPADLVFVAGEPTYARFRLSNHSLTVASMNGRSDSGEVEDYRIDADTLPVTLNAFASELNGAGELTVQWQTASETDNVGFELWGLVDGEWQALGEIVESKAMNSALPQTYESKLAAPAGLASLQLVDYDTRGRAEQFGPFSLGAEHGEIQPVERVDWRGPRLQRAERLEERGFVATGAPPGLRVAAGAPTAGAEGGSEEPSPQARWRKLEPGGAIAAAASVEGSSLVAIHAEGKGGKGKGRGNDGHDKGEGDDDRGGDPSHRTILMNRDAMTHVAVTESGVQRVTYEALRDGGLDLARVKSGQIAVTWRGEVVERWIDGPARFGPGSAIEFVARPPAGDDALYVDAALYQISVDRQRARAAKSIGRGAAKRVSPSYRRQLAVDRQLSYFPQSPTDDPWIERSVLVRGTATVTFELPVDGPVLDGESRLRVGLGTVSDMAEMTAADGTPIPEHNVEVWFAGPGTSFVWVASASTSGQQDWTIEAELPAGLLATGVNQVELRFATDYLFSLIAVDRYGVEYPAPYLGPSLDFPVDSSARGYAVEGFDSPAVAVYAEGADGSLTRIDPRVSAAGAGYRAEIRTWAADRFWVTDRPHAPQVFTTAAPGDLLVGPADLVVIADSSFVGTPALDEYVAQKWDFRPVVVDVEDVYNGFGFGMAVPGAITDYLAARDTIHPFSHVQLVGTDCYDRMNRVSSCVSFVPLPTAPVGVIHYSPSHNRLVDFDGDGIGDVAVGQFSVRTEAELATIVDKGASWQESGLASSRTALLVAEESDGRHSFAGQIDRLRSRLGWSAAEVLDMADHPAVSTARTALGSSLAAGRALTVFSGHSSPVVWAFRGLLTAGGVATLTNAGLPTLVVPLACETTYDVSPNANVLGHQLLYGGDRGAVAISGAVSLASLSENERMAEHVLAGLDAGLTLGEAVQAGRRALGTDFQTLQDNWMTQGDVTTRMVP